MRVGDRTDYNRLVIFIETDGSISPRDAFVTSVETMIAQLQVLTTISEKKSKVESLDVTSDSATEVDTDEDDVKKIKIDELNLSARTVNALLMAGIKTVAGIIRKTETDLHEVEGLGEKAVEEIKTAVEKLNLTLKQ
jgi:DNA-directed RNA polymerase subunit alpha